MMFLKAFSVTGQTLRGTTPDWPREELAPGFPSPAPLLTGVWTPAFRAGQMKLCATGWHLLPCTPYAIGRWIRRYGDTEASKRAAYLVEIAEGCTAKVVSSHSDKFIVTEARLVRQLTVDEVTALTEMKNVRQVMSRRSDYEAELVAIPKTIGSPTERRRLEEGAQWFRAANHRARSRAASVGRYGSYRPTPRVETVVVRSEDL